MRERKSSRWKLLRRTLGWSSPVCSKATPCLTTCSGLWPRIANGTRPILTTHERASAGHRYAVFVPEGASRGVSVLSRGGASICVGLGDHYRRAVSWLVYAVSAGQDRRRVGAGLGGHGGLRALHQTTANPGLHGAGHSALPLIEEFLRHGMELQIMIGLWYGGVSSNPLR